MKAPVEIEKRLLLARAWRLKGQTELARRALDNLLGDAPDHVGLHIEMGDLLLEEGRLEDAVRYYGNALDLEPDHPSLQFRRDYLSGLSGADSAQSEAVPPDHPRGRLNLLGQKRFGFHRSGWNVALDALTPLHHSRGVLFDGFVENNFAWKHWRDGIREAAVLRRLMAQGAFEELATSEEQGIVPYNRPWVGFFHNPHRMPHWFHYQESPQSILSKDIWRDSVRHCLGLFVLTRYQAEWLRTQVDVPVSVLTHPTEIPQSQFSYEAFESSSDRRIVQVGWWLRRLNAIYELPVARNNPLGYKKIRLVPRFFDDADNYLRSLMQKEMEELQIEIPAEYAENTVDVQHLPDAEYDELLSSNIVFLNLYDAGANCAIVECIARATPVLVNRLPPVVEYLGNDYPFYYVTLEEAAAKAIDTRLIRQTHRYLRSSPMREQMSPDRFRRQLRASIVFRSLPEVS